MSATYYVKVYFTKQQQQQPEIRRFAIDTTAENNIFQELCTKIATYQPDIQLNGFTLQYIDEENERITFSSSEELRSAISCNQDSNALKIFVTSTREPIQTGNKECHEGVECDGCKGSILGCRYKCVVCPNYDLCEKCSATGVHSEHNMIKITKPGNLYHPYGPRHHGGRRHHLRHFPPTPFVPNPELLEQIQAQIPQWLPNRENTAHFRTHMQHHLDSIKTNTQAHMQNSKQYLESVGQYLQQALSPFGIDCDYRVDGQTANQQSTTTTTTNNNENPPPPPAQAEPSAVPKDAEEAAKNQGISSWINMFRTGGENPPAVSATVSTETSSDSEKAVEECVEKMKAMGFEGKIDSFMELIRAKNGDLNSVLDEITHFHQD